MFKGPYELRELSLHRDERGDLFEVLRFPDDDIPGRGYIYTFSVNPGARRGDHYHERKHEWLTCVSGELTVLVEDKEGRAERFVLNAEKPSVMYFAPYTAHAVVNESGHVAVAASYGSEPHDPADPDTIKKIVAG